LPLQQLLLVKLPEFPPEKRDLSFGLWCAKLG